MARGLDAILAFGRDLGEENPLQGADDLAHFLLTQEGFENPFQTVPEEILVKQDKDVYDAWLLENPDVAEAQKEYTRRSLQIEEESPLKVITYNSLEHPHYFLALASTIQKTHGPSARVRTWWVSEEEIEDAKAWCEGRGLPEFAHPHWMMARYYC